VPRFGPIKRRDLIRSLQQVGFEGPYSGGKHQFMIKGDITLWIPNPHRGDIGRELLAIAYTAGREQGRTQLRSTTGHVRLGVRADRSEIRADDSDLAFVDITLEDQNGTVATHLDRPVTVQVRGAGVLQGLGSARPRTEERFDAATHTTFDGRALAIVRPNGEGAIEVTVRTEGCDPQTVRMNAR